MTALHIGEPSHLQGLCYRCAFCVMVPGAPPGRGSAEGCDEILDQPLEGDLWVRLVESEGSTGGEGSWRLPKEFGTLLGLLAGPGAVSRPELLGKVWQLSRGGAGQEAEASHLQLRQGSVFECRRLLRKERQGLLLLLVFTVLPSVTCR